VAIDDSTKKIGVELFICQAPLDCRAGLLRRAIESMLDFLCQQDPIHLPIFDVSGADLNRFEFRIKTTAAGS
jgi:hypothetical protein